MQPRQGLLGACAEAQERQHGRKKFYGLSHEENWAGLFIGWGGGGSFSAHSTLVCTILSVLHKYSSFLAQDPLKMEMLLTAATPGQNILQTILPSLFTAHLAVSGRRAHRRMERAWFQGYAHWSWQSEPSEAVQPWASYLKVSEPTCSLPTQR